jgi:purine-binding chemotaxis protein CheW
MAIKNGVNSTELQVLTFSLEGVSYGVDVNQVREVKNFESVTPVPYAPTYIKGITNLRGEVVPVVDLRKHFGIQEKKSGETGIMIVVQDKHPIGVMVDAAMDVLTISRKDIDQTPNTLKTNRSDLMLGIAKHEKELIMLLDLGRIVSSTGAENLEKGFEIKTNMDSKT